MTSQLPDAETLRELLGPRSMWGPLHVVASTGSTNADVAARARVGDAEGYVVVAHEQTAGRGRLDRTWASPAGTSISMSVLLDPRPALPQWGWLSLLTGLAVSAALADLAPDPGRVQLKWPNDVLIGGQKVCGILSERVEHARGARAVVGLGINVALEREQLPVATATSLLLEGFGLDQNRILAGVLQHFEVYYQRWQQSGSLRPEYQARCASIGAELAITADAGRPVRGRGHGIDELGRIRVATAGGIETFAVGDVVHARLGG